MATAVLSSTLAALAAPTAAPPPACPIGELGAFAELGCELNKTFGSLGADVAVAVGPVKSDRPVTKTVEFSARLGRSVATTSSPGVKLLDAPTLAEARALARNAKLLVFVTPEIIGGELHATADEYPVIHGFWDRLRSPAPDAIVHAFATRRLDGEVASFLPKVPLVTTRTDRSPLPATDVVALACGASNTAGGLELVLVGRRKIQLGQIRNGAFTPSAETSWSTLSPVAPSPLREPIAAVDLEPGQRVAVGSTDRAAGFLLSATLAPITKLGGEIPFPGVGCLARAGVALGSPTPCAPGDAPRVNVGELGVIDAFASTTTIDDTGRARTVIAFRNANDHTVTLRDDAGRTARVTGAGAAFALGDVDVDGEPDLVTSVDTLNPAEDRLVVSSWGSDGAMHERFRVPAPDGVHAIAACPPDDAGLSPIVVATGASLWILR